MRTQITNASIPIGQTVANPSQQVTVQVLGMPGPPGPPGSGITDAQALHVSMQLSEFADETARAAARANLGLATFDGGTF